MSLGTAQADASRSAAEEEWPRLLVGDLLTGVRSACTWGSGAIGSSALHAFASVGVKCIGYDISEDRVREIQGGRYGVTSAHTSPEQVAGLPIKATNEWTDLQHESIAVHLVCVPTERGAEPSDGALRDVIPHIARVIKNSPQASTAPVVVIESTVLPSWIQGIIISGLERAGLKVGADVLVGAAPRRDWFSDASHTLRTLPRIVGGYDDATTAVLYEFYSLVCDTVQPALDASHAALTKVIENVIRFEGITLGNRLALALPQYDMRHVLRLASTKWNIPYYFPSMGVGGHCIPLAPQYVLAEANRSPYLDAIETSLSFNRDYFGDLYETRLKGMLADKRSIGILGLAYTPDAKMHKLSPAFGALETLRGTPRLRLHDPFYSADEIYDLCSVPVLRLPRDIATCDALILVTPHTAYRELPIEHFVEPGTVIIDNTGLWAQRSFANGVEYYEIGRIRGQSVVTPEPHSSQAD
jgi:nucleotide sugar dehydrogenase